MRRPRRPPVDQRSLDRVFVSGWVEDVDRESRRVRITHGPIDELGWPAMTMDFELAPGASLEGLAPGDAVEFEMSGRGDGFRILSLRSLQSRRGEP